MVEVEHAAEALPARNTAACGGVVVLCSDEFVTEPLVIALCDNQLRHRSWHDSAWDPGETAWLATGGMFATSPAVSSWSGRLDVFAVSAAGQVAHKTLKGNTWQAGDWEGL